MVGGGVSVAMRSLRNSVFLARRLASSGTSAESYKCSSSNSGCTLTSEPGRGVSSGPVLLMFKFIYGRFLASLGAGGANNGAGSSAASSLSLSGIYTSFRLRLNCFLTGFRCFGFDLRFAGFGSGNGGFEGGGGQAGSGGHTGSGGSGFCCCCCSFFFCFVERV